MTEAEKFVRKLIESNRTPSTARYQIVALFLKQRDTLYGYQIAQEINVSSSTIYDNLIFLHNHGLITKVESSLEEVRRPRNSYALTELGIIYAIELAVLDEVTNKSNRPLKKAYT